MQQRFELDWLAAGEITFDDKLIPFDRIPHMAVANSSCLLIAGARDHGIIAVDIATGDLLFTHDEHRGETVGVLVDRTRTITMNGTTIAQSRVFIVTTSSVHLYHLTDNILDYMALVKTPDVGDGQFTNAMAIDVQSRRLYLRHTTGAAYRIYSIDYHRMTYEEVCLGSENCLTTITQLCKHNEVVYGVQGSVGALVDLTDLKKTVHRVHGSVSSITASPSCLVTTQLEGQGVVLWTPSCDDNDQFRISASQLFPQGQDATVLLHNNLLVVFHASRSLLHLFEWRTTDTPPSEMACAVLSDPFDAFVSKNICRHMGKADVMTADELIDMMINNDDEEEELVTIEQPPKVACTIADVHGNESVDPIFFSLLDPSDAPDYFHQWTCADDPNILFYLPQVPCL